MWCYPTCEKLSNAGGEGQSWADGMGMIQSVVLCPRALAKELLKPNQLVMGKYVIRCFKDHSCPVWGLAWSLQAVFSDSGLGWILWKDFWVGRVEGMSLSWWDEDVSFLCAGEQGHKDKQ